MTWKHEGSVSSGTLRERDLIPAFFGALLRVAPDRAGELGRGYGYNPELSDSWMESAGSDAQGEFLCELDAMLNEAAPWGRVVLTEGRRSMQDGKSVMLGPEEVRALRGILHYLWEGEQEDYSEQDDCGRREHIYVDLIKLRDALGLGSELLGDLDA